MIQAAIIQVAHALQSIKLSRIARPMQLTDACLAWPCRQLTA